MFKVQKILLFSCYWLTLCCWVQLICHRRCWPVMWSPRYWEVGESDGRTSTWVWPSSATFHKVQMETSANLPVSITPALSLALLNRFRTKQGILLNEVGPCSNRHVPLWQMTNYVTYCQQLPRDQAGGWVAAIALSWGHCHWMPENIRLINALNDSIKHGCYWDRWPFCWHPILVFNQPPMLSRPFTASWTINKYWPKCVEALWQ